MLFRVWGKKFPDFGGIVGDCLRRWSLGVEYAEWVRLNLIFVFFVDFAQTITQVAS